MSTEQHDPKAYGVATVELEIAIAAEPDRVWQAMAGQVWYTVIGVAAPRMLTLQGLITPEFGGPTHTVLKLTLEAAGDGTLLKLTDTRFGRVGDGESTATRDGWRVLFEDGLKAHVERKR